MKKGDVNEEIKHIKRLPVHRPRKKKEKKKKKTAQKILWRQQNRGRRCAIMSHFLSANMTQSNLIPVEHTQKAYRKMTLYCNIHITVRRNIINLVHRLPYQYLLMPHALLNHLRLSLHRLLLEARGRPSLRLA